LAYALGEESFTDQNGNGIYDPGEPYTRPLKIYLLLSPRRKPPFFRGLFRGGAAMVMIAVSAGFSFLTRSRGVC